MAVMSTISSAPKTADSTEPSVLTELDITSSRPLSPSERFFVFTRGKFGASDAFPLITLDCSPSTPILDDEVVLAWAVLCLRHPMLTSRVTFTASDPAVVCSAALTLSRAIARAKAHIEFAQFDDRDRALDELHAQFGGPSPVRAIDVRAEMHVVWQRDASGERGQYVFGMQTVHYQLDARRRIEVMRQFVELLATPGRAQAELDAHFAKGAGTVLPPKIPQPVESSFPDLGAFDAEERRKGKEAFDEFVRKANVLPCGLAYDGPETPSGSNIRCIRRTFSQPDTTRILQACKAQNITVTQLFQAAWAVAAVEIGREEACDVTRVRPGLALQDGLYHCNTLIPVDLAPYIRALPGNTNAGGADVSMQLVWYTSTIALPQAALDVRDAVWAAARIAKANDAAFRQSPYFWHLVIHIQAPMQEHASIAFNGEEEAAGPVASPPPPPPLPPLMPFLTSLGDISALLPSTISASSCEGGTYTDGRSIRVVDMMVCMKVMPTTGTSHVWTFDGRMVLQLTYDSASFSAARGDKFFGRVADIFAGLATEP
ncbi:hypothetical protein B0H21DRAFT_582095 [Amylocystis lapponica]|nr:hypothetical protein B0H21DRAFT_582095 [Amylocystis lapponica]